MGKFLDFQEIKAKTTFEMVIAKLNLPAKRTGNQWRMQCPACNSGGQRSLVITEGRGFFCFAAAAGGDQIKLVEHINGVSAKDAAAFLVGEEYRTSTTVRDNSKTVPESDGGDETQKFAPLSYLLQEHQAVDAIGFSPEICAKTGIGFAPKGILRGLVAIPIRDEHGNLLGYIGISDAKLPSSFMTNVVELRPKTA